jgi:ankyrin repeat protein
MERAGSNDQELLTQRAEDWFIHYNILEFFGPVSSPEKNDLVLYTRNITDNREENFCPLHSGLVHSDDLVEGKWGSCKTILLHPTFHVPESYGEVVIYYRPLLLGDELFGAFVERATTIQKQPEIVTMLEKRTRKTKKKLFFTAGESIKFVASPDTKKEISLIYTNKTHRLLEQNRYFDINTKNETQQTLLMLAAKGGNLSLAQLLIAHKIDIHATDLNGDTALNYAINNQNDEIVQLLNSLS